MVTATWAHEAVCISLTDNTLGTGVHLSIQPSTKNNY